MSVLYTLLLVVSLLVSSIMMFGEPGIFVFLLVGLFPLLLYWIRSIALAVFCYIMILLLIALLLPTVSCAREAARCMQCRNNMKQLGLALYNYKQHFKSFPPAITYDDNGKPMHSWRVLILPFVESETIYKHYDFNEPWNGPNNRELLDKRPWGYACSSDIHASDEDESLTNYAAYVGPDTIWSGNRNGLSSSTSVMLVETLNSDIKWTEPRDIVVPVENDFENENSHPTISSIHIIAPGYFWHNIPATNVIFYDGHAELLPAAFFSDNNILHTDGESFRKATDRWIAEHRRINCQHCFGLAAWIVSLILLMHWARRCRHTVDKTTAEINENVEGAGEG